MATALAFLPFPLFALPAITEFLADNTSETLADENGDTEDWIEITNTGTSPIDLAGYFLVDSTSGSNPWEFPTPTPLAPGAAIVVFASDKDRDTPGGQLHTNFKLSAAADSITLFDPLGNSVSSFAWASPPGQFPGISFGTFASEERFFETPTPGTPNAEPFFVPGRVQFSQPSQTFTGQITLELTTDFPGATIRYTTDRSVPEAGAGSIVYTGPITIDATTMVRARIEDPATGGLGELSGRHYIQLSTETISAVARAGAATLPAFTSNLPILIMDVFGGDAFTGNNSRPAVVFVFEPGTDGRASILGEPTYDFRIQGNVRGRSSSNFPKQQYRVEIRNQEDQQRSLPLLGLPSEADWVFGAPFLDKPLIRNSTVFALGREIGLLAPRTRHFELFINGFDGDNVPNDNLGYRTHYRGVYLLTENIKRDRARVDVTPLLPGDNEEPEISGGYVMAWDNNVTEAGERIPGYSNIRIVEPNPDDATSAQKQWISDFITSFDTALTGPDSSDPDLGFRPFLDVPSYVNLFAINELTRDQDAYIRSSFFYKDRDGPLIMGPLWDYNLIWNVGCCRNNRNASPPNANDSGWQYIENDDTLSEVSWETNLLQDPDFLQAFTDRWQQLRKTVFSLEGLSSRLDAQAAPLAEAAVRNFAEYRILRQTNPTLRNGNPSFFTTPSTRSWEAQISVIKEWITERMAWVDAQFLEAPTITRTGTNISFTQPGGNTTYYTTDGTDPRLSGGGINPMATATIDFTLIDNAAIVARSRDSAGLWSGPAIAIVSTTATPAAQGNIVVSEIHYHPAAPTGDEIDSGFTTRGDFEFIELQNIGATPTDLSLSSFTDGVSYTFPIGSIFQPGERIVLAANTDAFASRHPDITPTDQLDPVKQLDNSGDRIRLVTPCHETILDFLYDDRAPWPESPDGDGPSLVLITPSSFPDHNLAQNWRPSTASDGNPGTSDSIPFTAPPDADEDGDGLSAFLEYVIGTSDDIPDPSPLTIGLDGTRLILGHPRNPLASNVTFAFEGSSDLSDWTRLDPQPTPDPEATSSQLRYFLPTDTATTGRLFLRVIAEGN